MDTVTHSLVGAAISDGWFRKRLGPLATPFALVASALPDADIFTYLISPESAWMHHRGYTHSLFIMILAAPVLGLGGYFLSRRRGEWWRWALLALLCLYAHTIIDLVTSWGTMPLLPFSNARVSWDVAPILDIFVTSVTAASFVLNRILRWERVDTFINPLAYPVVHRHPRRQRVGDRVGAVATVLVVVYLLLGWHQNWQTVKVARAALEAEGIAVSEVRALPIMFTYIAWNIVARDTDGNVYNAVHSSYSPQPLRFRKYPTLPHEEVRTVLDSPEGRMFRWYSQNMFIANRQPAGDGWQVNLEDRRFFTMTRPDRSQFVMVFTEAPDGSVTGVRSVQAALDGISIRDELDRLWNLTWRGRPEPTGAPEAAAIPVSDG
ncbi:MAG: metal-dependent hydrolase [Planctomycetes bacterium]|nr:metal-dependent hydrolase [Planctomycetota bacterium]